MSSVVNKDGFSRNVKGRVPADSILEAIRLMEMGREFEVMYYPRVGSPEFVVEQEVVDKSLSLCWSEGMRIKMSVETEDSSRMTWFQGKVTRNNVRDSGLWSYSPWRMLQVTWDEPEVLPNVTAVSPWQVELVPTSHHMHAPFPPMKKLRAQGLELSSDGHGSIVVPQSLTDSMKMGNLTPFPTFPAGMQGARHEFCVPSLSDFLHRNTNQMFSDNFYGIKVPEELNRTQREASSPPSQESIHNHDQDLLGVAACTQTRKVGKGSIQLFGKIIHTNDPDDNSVDGEYAANEGVRSLEFFTIFPTQPVV
ncbi:uncharacterized protein A4U43_C10F18190 [Asparagus officinalis]|uniref:Auxin response factor domain-containing protein n=2 Tax=Asparagus officinalis TaxID=4686 RepID=A0A5P1E3Q7_ASPOF|nr:uncharacterized protein A4U43_C10F18190 [Asparagus officinalis]